MEENKTCYCSELLKSNENFKLSQENEVYSIFGNLNRGEKIIIKYFGKLVNDEQNQDKKILFNYGYGNLWTDKNVLEMQECCHSDKKCYCLELELINNDNLFFCFMDNNNNWDLIGSSSYMIPVSECITTMAKKNIEIALIEEEYMSFSAKLLKKLTDKLLNLFATIGDLIYKKVKT
jgi:hypothetical protein